MNILPTHDSHPVREPTQSQAPRPPHRHNSENLAIERRGFADRIAIEFPSQRRNHRYTVEPMTHNEINSLIEHLPPELLR